MSTDRPILFTPDNVRKILDGGKTQTRRVIKPQPVPYDECGHPFAGFPWMPVGGVHQDRWPCPFGQVGDHLWVRETWQHNPFGGIVYKAGSGIVNCDGRGWKPSIHMPRWASRLTLEITAVKIEQVQDISEDDAMAEVGHYVQEGVIAL